MFDHSLNTYAAIAASLQSLDPFNPAPGLPEGPQPGPSGWAQAWPKLGPSRAQARNLGPKKKQKIKILKIKIHVAQNVGKVWISRKKNLPAPFGASQAIFCVGRKNRKDVIFLPIFLGGPICPFHILERPGPIGPPRKINKILTFF